VGDDEMERLVATIERRLGRAWGEAVEWLRDQNQLDDVAERLRAGDLAGAIQGVEDAAIRFATEVHDGYVTSGQKAAAWLDDLVADKLVSFDAAGTRAVAWAEQNKTDMIRDLGIEQHEVIRDVVGEGVNAGRSAQVIARDLRDSIGLTPTQERHVASYRRALESGDLRDALGRELRDARSDKALRRALENSTAIDPARIDGMVERYRTNYVAFRADVIARTEALRAVHEGAEELLQQAAEAGQIADDMVVVRRWNSLHDKRTRASHRVMHGQERRLGQRFETGAGYPIAYPGDPDARSEEIVGCRCFLTTHLVPA
jgi:hypothetical protein